MVCPVQVPKDDTIAWDTFALVSTSSFLGAVSPIFWVGTKISNWKEESSHEDVPFFAFKVLLLPCEDFS